MNVEYVTCPRCDGAGSSGAGFVGADRCDTPLTEDDLMPVAHGGDYE